VLVADLASEAGIEAVAARAAAAPLDLVINNAGIGGYRRFVELDPKVADALIAIHVRAVVRVTLAALPGMVERKQGGVINVASLLAFSGAATDAFFPKRAVYAGAKAFLVTFTQALANELTDSGVRVQVCLPGVIKTEFHEVQGMDLSKMPRMSPDDLARASLAGLRLGEVVCVPALEDVTAVQRIDDANRAVLEVSRSTTTAARYR
jgi:short-subunit dehydrogenase